MQKVHQARNDKRVYITVAVFYALKQAESTFQDLHLKRKLRGGKSAVIVEKDLRGDLHLQELGINTCDTIKNWQLWFQPLSPPLFLERILASTDAQTFALN